MIATTQNGISARGLKPRQVWHRRNGSTPLNSCRLSLSSRLSRLLSPPLASLLRQWLGAFAEEKQVGQHSAEVN